MFWIYQTWRWGRGDSAEASAGKWMRSFCPVFPTFKLFATLRSPPLRILASLLEEKEIFVLDSYQSLTSASVCTHTSKEFFIQRFFCLRSAGKICYCLYSWDVHITGMEKVKQNSSTKIVLLKMAGKAVIFCMWQAEKIRKELWNTLNVFRADRAHVERYTTYHKHKYQMI